jgi:hypothetical protein
MTITELIKELQVILETKGDLSIGCSDASPDEGYAYPVYAVDLVECDVLVAPYVDICVDTDDCKGRLNVYIEDEDEE